MLFYESYTPPTPADVPKEALAGVWGRWDSGRLVSEVVCTTRINKLKKGCVSLPKPSSTKGGFCSSGGKCLLLRAAATTW